MTVKLYLRHWCKICIDSKREVKTSEAASAASVASVAPPASPCPSDRTCNLSINSTNQASLASSTSSSSETYDTPPLPTPPHASTRRFHLLLLPPPHIQMNIEKNKIRKSNRIMRPSSGKLNEVICKSIGNGERKRREEWGGEGGGSPGVFYLLVAF